MEKENYKGAKGSTQIVLPPSKTNIVMVVPGEFAYSFALARPSLRKRNAMFDKHGMFNTSDLGKAKELKSEKDFREFAKDMIRLVCSGASKWPVDDEGNGTGEIITFSLESSTTDDELDNLDGMVFDRLLDAISPMMGVTEKDKYFRELGNKGGAQAPGDVSLQPV